MLLTYIIFFKKSETILTKLSHLNRIDFKDLVALGTFASFENRVYLAGPCNTGKSSIASVLIGETIPKKWISTDGLIIHFGRNGIDLQRKKMVPLKKGISYHTYIFSNVLKCTISFVYHIALHAE